MQTVAAKLVVTLMLSLDTEQVHTFKFPSLSECLHAKQQQTLLLDNLNYDSLIIGYSIRCETK